MASLVRFDVGGSTGTYQPVVFCKPTAAQFPMDSVTTRIVQALQERNFSIPGINVNFYESTIGSPIQRSVSKIEGPDFKLIFYRKGNGVAQITIPQKELNIFDDESGPTLYVYVGKDWGKDRDQFVNRVKFDAKQKGLPRTYLRYTGTTNPQEPEMQYQTRGSRSPYLVPVYKSSEYSPELGDVTCYKTEEVFAEFVSYLEEYVLKRIEQSL